MINARPDVSVQQKRISEQIICPRAGQLGSSPSVQPDSVQTVCGFPLSINAYDQLSDMETHTEIQNSVQQSSDEIEELGQGLIDPRTTRSQRNKVHQVQIPESKDQSSVKPVQSVQTIPKSVSSVKKAETPVKSAQSGAGRQLIQDKVQKPFYFHVSII